MGKTILALSDGTIFEGESFGAEGETIGEVVFNTSMIGYQEILTDPSYKGQIVTMTYPLIGNYGVNFEDFESEKPHLAGFVVLENSQIASNWRSKQTLSDFLKKNKIVAIEGVDTRRITLELRNSGAMKGVISTKDFNHKRLLKKVKESQSLVGIDLVKEVTCNKKYEWNKKGKYKV